MKKVTLLLIGLIGLSAVPAVSQTKKMEIFKPAEAKRNHYDALYVLNESDDKKIRGLLRNINNVLNDPRLKGKLHIEVIAFSDGVEMYKKSNDYQSLLVALKEKGVFFTQCSKTMEERKISKEELYDFVSYVPSGNGEIILRQYQGWAIVHP